MNWATRSLPASTGWVIRSERTGPEVLSSRPPGLEPQSSSVVDGPPQVTERYASERSVDTNPDPLPTIVFDVLARLLRSRFELTYVRNITDVDDKINAAAKESGLDIGAITVRYIDAYHEDMRALGVLPPDIEPRATEHIAAMVPRGHRSPARRGCRRLRVPVLVGAALGRRAQPRRKARLLEPVWRPERDLLEPGLRA